MRDVGGNMGNMNGKCVFLWRNAAELWWGLKRIDRYFLLNNQGVTGKIKSDVLRNEKYGRKAEIPSAKLIRNGCWR